VAKEAPKQSSRFTEAESERNSAIQSLAVKYYGAGDDEDWIQCVSKATKEVDAKD
jgi:hypothetical protein